MTTTAGKLLSVGDFAVITDDKLVPYGIGLGAKVYLAGEYLLPFENDPYNYRKIFIAVVLDEDGHVKTKEKGFTVDPVRLELLPDDEQEGLAAIRDEDFRHLACNDEATN